MSERKPPRKTIPGAAPGDAPGRRLSPRPGVLESGRRCRGAGIRRSWRRAEWRTISIIPATPAEGRPPCVLQVIPSLVSGGVERGTIDVAAGARRRRLDRRSSPPPAGRWNASWPAPARRISRLPLASKNPLAIRRNAARWPRSSASTGSTSSTPAAAPRRGARGWRRSATRRHFVTTFHNAYDAAAAAQAPLQLGDGARRAGHRDLGVRRRPCRRALRDRPDRLRTIPRGVDLGTVRSATGSTATASSLWRTNGGCPRVTRSSCCRAG